MKIIFTSIFITFLLSASAQNKLVTYTKTWDGIALNKNEIFDKVHTWFEKSFYNTYDKINVSNKEAGIISGQAFFYSPYKILKNTDSTEASDFANYYLDWSAKVTNGRIVFTITKILINKGNVYESKATPVTASATSPFIILMQPEETTQEQWLLAKAYLKKNLDGLTNTLLNELSPDNSGLAGLK
ncbi:MAG: DUF4468 domain-containing protein [Bacteroidota bacterium]